MFNKSILMGRICNDIELKTTQIGASVISFRLAVERKYQPDKSNKAVDFINIVAWRNTAEFIEKYFSKGDGILVEGELQMRKYTDKNNHEQTIAEVIIDEARFPVGGSKASNNNLSHGSPPVPASVPAPAATANSPVQVQTTDDDYPF